MQILGSFTQLCEALCRWWSVWVLTGGPEMIREFLYVDVNRTRSLLAQLEGGVIEAEVRRTGLDDTNELGAKVLGIGGKGSWATSESHEESRSLVDLTFVVFEEAAAAQGLVVDAQIVTDPTEWRSGSVHSLFQEGEILRITGDIQITDPAFVSNRFALLDEFMASLVEMQVEMLKDEALRQVGVDLSELRGQLARAPRDQRRQLERRLLQAEEDAESSARAGVEAQLRVGELESMKKLGVVLRSFLGDTISARLLACGDQQPELGFAGSLLGRDEYIQREREELFSRYGSVLRNWTMVMQIANIPPLEDSSAGVSIDSSAWTDLMSSGGINRAAFEAAASGLLRMLESFGVAEGPRWPTISVVPLAIYREVPGPSDQD